MAEMISIPISESIDRSELFGGMDKNLKVIEESLKVDIIQRDNELILKGENAADARALLEEMMMVLEKGDKLDEQKINYIADLSDKGVSYGQAEVGRDIICFTHEGRPLRPKTIGQKGYVRHHQEEGYSLRHRSRRNGQDVYRCGHGGQCL